MNGWHVETWRTKFKDQFNLQEILFKLKFSGEVSVDNRGHVSTSANRTSFILSKLSGQTSHRAHPHQCDMNDLRFSFQFTPCRTRDQPCNLRSTNSYFCSRCSRRPASESGHINPLFQSFDALNVPNELLAQILIFCCPEPNTPQLVVTWICSRWRIIALGLWELWNCILLTFVLSVTICPSQV